MLTMTLQWMIDNHPWPDGAPLWAHLACTLAPLAVLGYVYMRTPRDAGPRARN